MISEGADLQRRNDQKADFQTEPLDAIAFPTGHDRRNFRTALPLFRLAVMNALIAKRKTEDSDFERGNKVNDKWSKA